MNNQKTTIISRLCKIILVLLALSVLYTIIVYFTSSGSSEAWQSPEINPYRQFNVTPQSFTSKHATNNYEQINQLCNDPDEVHSNNRIIGSFQEGNYTITLTDQGDEILESVSGYGNKLEYSLKPERIGITHFDEESLEIPDTTAGIVLYRISLKMPENESDQKIKNIDIYDVWSERAWHLGENKNIMHTEGRFYVNYGQEIIRVIDKSYSVTSPFFDRYQDCSAETGHGDTAGWITTNNIWSLRNFPTNTKFSTSAWITVDIYYNTRLGISSDKWLSTSLPISANKEFHSKAVQQTG